MALGALNIVSRIAAVGPVQHLVCTLAGDGAYPAGGSAGLLAKVRAAMQQPGLVILAVHDRGAPGILNRPEYDAGNDKLFMRVKTTSAESAVANQAAITYDLLIVCG